MWTLFTFFELTPLRAVLLAAERSRVLFASLRSGRAKCAAPRLHCKLSSVNFTAIQQWKGEWKVPEHLDSRPKFVRLRQSSGRMSSRRSGMSSGMSVRNKQWMYVQHTALEQCVSVLNGSTNTLRGQTSAVLAQIYSVHENRLWPQASAFAFLRS